MGSIINLAVLWVAAMGWHLWRIITLRPAYKYLSDTVGMAVSFLAVYVVAGLVRWFWLDSQATDKALTFGSFGLVMLNLILFGLVLGLLFERNRRGASLLSSMLGLSAGIDLLMSAAYLAGFSDSVRMPPGVDLGLEIGLSLVLAWRFSQEPEDVQRHGYRRGPQHIAGSIEVPEAINIR